MTVTDRLAELRQMIAAYDAWLTSPPRYTSRIHVDTARERLSHLRAEVADLAQGGATAGAEDRRYWDDLYADEPVTKSEAA